jgi:cell division protein FtsA
MSNYIVAIDLGSSKIAGMLAERTGEGLLRIVAMEEEPSQGVKRGLIINHSEAANCVSKIVKKLQNRINLDIVKVYVGLGGNTLRSIENKICRNYNEERELADVDLKEMYEENKALPFPNESMYEIAELDFLLNNDFLRFDPKECSCTQIEGRYLLTLGKKGMNDAVCRCLERIPQKWAGMYMAPFSISEAVITPKEKELGSVVIDFGAETTSVVIYADNCMRAMRVLPIGGASVTKDMCSLHLTQSDAEQLKKQYACALVSLEEPQNITRKTNEVVALKINTQEINKIVEARMDEIMNMVCEEIYKAGYWGKLGGNVIITGGASKLKGLSELIAIKTGMNVRKGSFSHLLADNPEKQYLFPEYTLLVGLLNFGTENCCVDKNIKQEEELKSVEAPEIPVKRPKKNRIKGIADTLMGKLFEDREFED